MVLISIINGILILSLGVLVIKFRRNLKLWIGTFFWFENIFGRGSTYFLIILFGCFLMLLGFFWPFGGLDFMFQTK